MKKFLLLVFIFFLNSCTEHTYRMEYKVYYPNNIVEKNIITTGSMTPHVKSQNGTNHLVGADGVILSTTAPIEITTVEMIK